MATTIIPLYDKILVEKPKLKEHKTSSGIILPNDQKEESIEAKVLAVGEGKLTPEGKLIPLKVSVGDIVCFTKYAGSPINDNQIMLRESDVLGIVSVN